MNHEPSLEELIGSEDSGAERQRLQHVHELILQAGPPAELTPELEAGPTLATTLQRRRRVKPRPMLLLAAALVLALVFFAGYISNGGSSSTSSALVSMKLTGTSAVPNAQARLEVWQPRAGNWPMTLNVSGLHKLAPRRYYEVYLVRNGKLGPSCGVFRVKDAGQVQSVTLNSPYPLKKGDTWVVTRPGPGGAEPGTTVLRPVTA